MAYETKSKKRRPTEEEINKLILHYYDFNSRKVFGKKYYKLNEKEQSFIRDYSYEELHK